MPPDQNGESDTKGAVFGACFPAPAGPVRFARGSDELEIRAWKCKPAIAQLVEHLTVECCSNQMVPGSIPGGRTFRLVAMVEVC